MISTSLNQINSQRQLLRVFGGLNEGYACSEAELSKEKNFSSRGYPALETRKPRRKVRQATGMNGMYHLNGLVTVEGTTLRYAPDDGGDTVELKDALTDGEKKMVGMGTKVLIWPDKMSFDTAAGTLSALGSGWQQGGKSLTVTPCDAAGVVYMPNKFGATEPESPKNGDVWLKQAEDAPWSYRDALKLYSTAGGWQNILLNYCRVTCKGLGEAFKAGDTVTLTGIPGVVKNAYSADFGGDVAVDDVAGDSVILSIAPDIESVLYYGTCVVTGQSVVWTAMDGKTTQTFDGPFPDVTAQRRVPDLDWLTEHNNRVWGCSSTENVIYACKLGDATNWFSYRGTAADSYAVTVGSDGAFTGAATCMGYVLFFKENGLHKLYGTKPSDYQMSSIQCSGVAKGAPEPVRHQRDAVLPLDGRGDGVGRQPAHQGVGLAGRREPQPCDESSRRRAGGTVLPAHRKPRRAAAAGLRHRKGTLARGGRHRLGHVQHRAAALPLGQRGHLGRRREPGSRRRRRHGGIRGRDRRHRTRRPGRQVLQPGNGAAGRHGADGGDAVGQLRRRRVGRKGPGGHPGQAGAGEPALCPDPARHHAAAPDRKRTDRSEEHRHDAEQQRGRKSERRCAETLKA